MGLFLVAIALALLVLFEKRVRGRTGMEEQPSAASEASADESDEAEEGDKLRRAATG